MERRGILHEMDRAFDIEFWQRQGPEAIFAAAWEMVLDAYEWRQKSVAELTFQGSVESFQRIRR
jgi:hypothetical protein